MSIIIPTIRANNLLDDCIAACKRTAPDAEIVIADDPVSFAINCNRGAEKSTGDVLVFLNDDTEPQDDWLEPLVNELRDDVGIAGSKLCYPRFTRSNKIILGDIQHAGIYFDAPDGILTAHNITTDEPTRDVDAVTGACLAITKQLFNDCNGFDESFVNGYEDCDLCLRVRTGGWRVRYVADSVVVHHESQSGDARWTHVAENIQRLQDRWAVRSE